ncbi:MAG: DUF3006 domain-containing protein [Oscillospiraceae bacterium]|nr:DUF3006 domain-containing protein [Oscillospiraceae bacterium]
MIIIERFENNIALLEKDGVIVKVKRNLIPKTAKEGDLLIITNGIYTVDKQATQKRREEVLERTRKLFKDF